MSREPNDKAMTLRCTDRRNAATKYITGPITVRGQTHSPQEIVAVYQAPLDARANLKAARLEVKHLLLARQAADDAMEIQDEFVQSFVDTTFGPDSQEAVDFGYATRRTPKVTATEKVEAAQKAKVTRKALGTKGKKQKKQAKKDLAAAGAQPAVQPAAPGEAPPTPSKS